MIDPTVYTKIETRDGKYWVVLYTTERYYVVQSYMHGIRQTSYRTSVFFKAARELEKYGKEIGEKVKEKVGPNNEES